LAISGYLLLLAHRRNPLGPACMLLGLAFAAKISAAPMIIAALGVICCLDRDRLVQRIAIGSGWMLAGAVVGEPALVLRPAQYWAWTFAGTGHGADDPSIGPGAWLRHIVAGPHPFASSWWIEAFSTPATATRGALPPGGWWILAIVVPVAGAVGQGLWRRLPGRGEDAPVAAAVAVAMGLALILAIIAKVHRLWDFYLHPGLVLAVAGAAMLASVPRGPVLRRWVLGILSVGLVAWVVTGLGANAAAIRVVAGREASAPYRTLAIQHAHAREAVDAAAAILGREPVVVLDPRLWDLRDRPGTNRVHAWGAKPWEHRGDLLILGPDAPLDAGGAAAAGWRPWAGTGSAEGLVMMAGETLARPRLP
jgi:hypothetical protein